MGKFDEVFDDVVVNAKAAASVVSKKASTIYDTSKHKITAAEIRSEINKKLRDLGTFTYKAEVHGLDMTEQIKATVAEIQELKDNLDIINDHIDAIKNQKKCPQCEAKVPKNSLFCNICGAKLEEEEESAEQPETEAAAPAADYAEEIIDEPEETEAAAE